MRLLVTGGGRGIGRATALAAAARGASVAVGYRGDAAAAQATLDALRCAGGGGLTVQGDVACADQVSAMFDAADAGLGGLDAVVVNAGIVAPLMPLAEMPPERIERMIRVNVLGALYVAREAARRLPDHAGAGIVLVSSVAARLGSPGEFVDYAASKGAVDSLTIGLAKELAPRGIRVNAVRPGLIETDIHISAGAPDRAARLGAGVPLGRAGTPEEVAEAILWLLDPASSYVTGALIDVSGGR